MDSLTHIAIGACIGDLFLGRKIGKKAMLYGAIAASLPDVDFIFSFWLGPADNLLAHRGFTHSFLFAALAVLLLAFIFGKKHSADKVPEKIWLIFMGTEISVHLFLDALNAYGVGWFEPFNHNRISFNVIFVADPFFSVWLGIAVVALIILKRNNRRRAIWSWSGLLLSSLYLIYCLTNKSKIDNYTRLLLARNGIHYSRYFTTPSPFNNWLWLVVAEADSGFNIGYRSVFDKNRNMELHYFPRNAHLLKPYNRLPDLQKLIRFSQGYYTADISPKGIEFNDLRFGQIMGWQDRDAPFVFHYYVQDTAANQMLVQRGRFTNWNRETLRFFMKRIKGE